MKSTHTHVARPPACAGTFYDANPVALRRDIRAQLDAAGPAASPGPIRGIVAPHAGHLFSGAPAARAYRLLEGTGVRRVILTGPCHRVPFHGVAATLDSAFDTPLGSVPLDTDFVARLIETTDFTEENRLAHRDEHSLEVHLPFLQVVLTEWKLVPLLISRQSWDMTQRLGEALVMLLRDDPTPTVLIASSDLYHGNDRDACEASDRLCAEAIERFDPESFHMGAANREYQACGAGPIAAAMLASRALGATASRVLCVTNSSETFPTPHADRVVGYLSAVFHG